MHGFTRDPASGMWYSKARGGLWWDPTTRECFSVADQVWTQGGRWPSAPANNAVAGGADELSLYLDADAVLGFYLSMPFEERRRFFVLFNDAESEFTIEDIRLLIGALRDAGIDLADRDGYYRFIQAQEGTQAPTPANRSPRARGYIRGGRRR